MATGSSVAPINRYSRRASRLAVVALLGASTASCLRGSAKVDVGPAATESRYPVEWAGCAVVWAGPLCELGADRRLTVWTSAPDVASWEFAADGGHAIPTRAEPLQDGWTVSFSVPPEAHRVFAVRATDHVRTWSLAVRTGSSSADIDAAVLAGKTGSAQAAKQLQEWANSTDPSRRDRAEAGYARVMLAQGKMGEAEAAFRRALLADRRDGRLSDEMRDGSALMWGLVVMQQRFADSRAILSSLATARDGYPEGRAWYSQDEGLLAAQTGDIRGAVAAYRAALPLSERLGRSTLSNTIAQNLATILDFEGRSEEAISILDRLPTPDDPCAQASLMLDRAEAITRLAQRRSVERARVEAVHAEAQRAAALCANPHVRLLAMVNASTYWLAVGDSRQTDALLQRLQRLPETSEPIEHAWRAKLVGQWKLARHESREALRLFSEAAAVAHAAGLEDERFDAEVGAGEALLALGHRDQGVRRLQAAQEVQWELLRNIPLTEGRGEFLNSHSEGVRHLVDSLVDQGASLEAMTVARVERAAEVNDAVKLYRLRSLPADRRRQWDEALERYAQLRRSIEREASEDWKLPSGQVLRARANRSLRAEEARAALDQAFGHLIQGSTEGSRAFPPPAEGEATLALFPGAREWIAFLRTSKTVEARRFSEETLASDRTASAILELFSAQLASARQITVLPFGLSDRVEWHLVPWRGKPLIASMDVSYGLDLSIPDRQDSGRLDLTAGALVVTDPTSDLASAASEGDLVAGALRGWPLVRFDGEAATRDALLRALPGAGLFHFAGHAEVGTTGGLVNGLLLAGGAHANIGDFLALSRVPEVVVLAACRAAAAPSSSVDEAPSSTLGLAQVFLAGGARVVVAPMGEVDDAATRAFMATFYKTLASQGLSSVSTAFRQAAVGAIGASAVAFRLIIP